MIFREFLNTHKDNVSENSHGSIVELKVGGKLNARMSMDDMKNLVEQGDKRGNLKVSGWESGVFHRWNGEDYAKLTVDLEESSEEVER